MASKRLSQKPFAILAMVLADAGAITRASAHKPSSTWLFHWPVLSFTKSINTGFLERVERVSGVMNSLEEGVIITLTLAPAFTSNRIKNADL